LVILCAVSPLISQRYNFILNINVFKIEIQLLAQHKELLPARQDARDQMNDLLTEEDTIIKAKREKVQVLEGMIESIRAKIEEDPTSVSNDNGPEEEESNGSNKRLREALPNDAESDSTSKRGRTKR
jgi:hypothetical protein